MSLCGVFWAGICAVFLSTGVCRGTAALAASAEEAFWRACSNGTPRDVRVAIEAGADVNAKDEEDWTGLMLAARFNSNPQVISALLKAGADPKAHDNSGDGVLFYATQNEALIDTPAMAELIKAVNR